MSASKHEYPNRPVKRSRPKSSETYRGKRKIWFSQGEPKHKLKIEPCNKLDPKPTIGHDNPHLRAFMHANRHNYVSIRQWGGKSRVNV